VADQPARAAFHETAGGEEHRVLCGGGHAKVEGVDRRPHVDHVEDVARDQVRARELRRRRARLVGEP
jgi:hypothetical protein